MENSEATVGEKIASTMQALPPAERRVARKLLSQYPVAGLNTVASLAEGAGVSGPTVLRFAKSLGFASYRDFQSALRNEVGQRQESLLSQAVLGVNAAQGPHDILRDAHQAYIRGIERTFSTLVGDEIDRVVTLLADPKRMILTFGGAYSAILADFLLTQLSPMRSGVRLLPSNPVAAAGSLEELTRHDVVVVFDFRRYDDSSEARARIAREHGANVILVTDRWLSPIAASADHVLTVDVVASGPSDTLVPALALLEALCDLTTSALGHSAIERLERVDPIRVTLQTPN
jgi:DNA-binding MurR/RpiR family transcriptional regulator